MVDLAAALAARQTAVNGSTLGLMLGQGDDTQSTVNLAAPETISSSMECHEIKRSKSWELLPWLCAKGEFQDPVMLPWLKAQSAVPSTLWLQPFRRM
jgi:hypothetical protein